MNRSQKQTRSGEALRQAQDERIGPICGELVEPQNAETAGFWDGFMNFK